MAITESLFFDKIKEDRDWYFVGYAPPSPGYKFAMLQLVALNEPTPVDIAAAMEKELRFWLERFPIPVMVSAFDCTGGLFDLSTVKPSNHLMGFRDADTEDIHAHWRLLQEDELPKDALDPNRLKQVYSAIPHRTGAELRAAALKKARDFRFAMRVGWSLVFLWAVVIPVVILVLGLANVLIGIALFIYSVAKAGIKAMKLLGWWKPSARDREKQRELELMRHHHLHCIENPQAFERLKLENFERWEKDRIKEEGKALKRE